MKILVIGQGGREHALAWKLAASPAVTQIFVAPGNAGTATESKVKNLEIAATDIEGLLNFAIQEQISYTVVGPEAPLALGIADTFHNAKQLCFGPSQAAAQLESSKRFAKDFMSRHGIPTASYQTFQSAQPALDWVRTAQFPIVIKASGLASGKGVIIAHDLAEAEKAIQAMLVEQRYGQAGQELVIEEFLTGEEVSFMAIVAGQTIVPLCSAQDHKTRDDGDRGPNTGGMGAYAPAHILTDHLQQRVMKDIMLPVLQGLAQENIPYLGFLYAGLMITPNGDPKVLEFNCRLGDPETQPVLMRLQSDLADVLAQALQGHLNTVRLKWDPRPALTVVLTAAGYPDHYPQGEIIQGLAQANQHPDCKIFHAGTRLANHQIQTAGGRVLNVTALGQSFLEAQTKAYAMAKEIHWDHLYYRRDIGYRAVSREKHALAG